MKKIISAGMLALAAVSATAQPMTYDRYYNLVAEKNVLYIAEKYNIDKAASPLLSVA